MTQWRFPPEARAQLTVILNGVDVPNTILKLEAGVTHYLMVRAEPAVAEIDQRLRAWAQTLRQRLNAAGDHLRGLQTVDANHLNVTGEFPDDLRAILERALNDASRAAAEIAHLRRGSPGPRIIPRMVLNGNLARALQMAGVTLSKGRTSVTHRVFVVVYDELGLISDDGDVFRALKQGVDLVTRGIHVRKVRHSRRIKAVI